MTDFALRRRMMVDTQVRPSDVTKFPIIDAMLKVERENFLPDALQETAYADENIDLGSARVTLEPRSLAKMLDALNISTDELVLDIGCGHGYSSAIIACMAQAVVAVEEDETMADEAESALVAAGADNVIVHKGPLADGASEHGPYDVILLQGGVATLPDAVADQLKDGGRIACLYMEGSLGVVRVGYKTGGRLSWRFAFNATAPVLPGFEKEAVFAL